MALTSNCNDMPTLFVDTQAPLGVLYDAASYRIQAVTQVLKNRSMRGTIECESFILSDFALLCAIPLRDGCDVLDVLGRRLRARPSA
ncbi:short-chain dehydrogenase [Pseudomonas fluorescens]|nr:short-chain dehydrogenase [Pseudomonas fluorescens]